MLSWHAASSIDDLRAAEAVLSRAWLDDAPFAGSHPGDLEWWYASSAPDDLAAHLRVWELGASPVGWSWVAADQVYWEVWSGEPSQDRPILEAILQAATEQTAGALHAWAAEDDPATLATMHEFGFRPGERRQSQFQRRIDAAPLPEASPATGYRIRAIRGPEEVASRVGAHRAAFAPSRMTIEKYARLVTLPHYRFADDLVVEAPDGSIAAFAMAWWDPVARIGEYEPVGTHPDHQRRGLGQALLGYGLRRYRELGARLVQVYSNTDNAGSEGLYEAVGFSRRRHHRLFERSRT